MAIEGRVRGKFYLEKGTDTVGSRSVKDGSKSAV